VAVFARRETKTWVWVIKEIQSAFHRFITSAYANEGSAQLHAPIPRNFGARLLLPQFLARTLYPLYENFPILPDSSIFLYCKMIIYILKFQIDLIHL